MGRTSTARPRRSLASIATTPRAYHRPELGPDASLVRATLVTGRQHQIRAHLAAVGFPIVGDKLYAHGDDAFMRYCSDDLVPELAKLFVLPRHALHAARVTFPHPDGGSPRTLPACSEYD